jgi:hypothetical protein
VIVRDNVTASQTDTATVTVSIRRNVHVVFNIGDSSIECFDQATVCCGFGIVSTSNFHLNNNMD